MYMCYSFFDKNFTSYVAALGGVDDIHAWRGLITAIHYNHNLIIRSTNGYIEAITFIVSIGRLEVITDDPMRIELKQMIDTLHTLEPLWLRVKENVSGELLDHINYLCYV